MTVSYHSPEDATKSYSRIFQLAEIDEAEVGPLPSLRRVLRAVFLCWCVGNVHLSHHPPIFKLHLGKCDHDGLNMSFKMVYGVYLQLRMSQAWSLNESSLEPSLQIITLGWIKP
jgi:hypothetical protein